MMMGFGYFITVVAQTTDSLDLKIGQLLIFGFYGNQPSASEPVYNAVKAGKVGNIILYGRNIPTQQTPKQLKEMIEFYQSAAPIPMWVSIDQEGGKVNRLKPELGFPQLASAKQVGSINKKKFTKSNTDSIVQPLVALGINLNYAPVVDVHNPDCPVLGAKERCYSSNPRKVARIASSVIDQHHHYGVLTVLKHFPGHGNSAADSHLGLTDVSKTWKKKELIPYKKLLRKNKVDGIMTAHIVNNQLDEAQLPATLSYKVITKLLRERLGFNGVIFSDDMQMKAISEQYGIEESIKMAFNAGVDVLMFSNNIQGVKDYSPDAIHATIKKLVIENQIDINKINQSFERVMALKQKKWNKN